ncbi:hypothetical protein GCM10023116_40990 [Kistimonas scapharcae]|uniref:Uncharacterized protein n=1 Tax=Kistimonas scapharcae TaxID=1036133 RepID=A0ABP8V9X4_9GAMM
MVISSFAIMGSPLRLMTAAAVISAMDIIDKRFAGLLDTVAIIVFLSWTKGSGVRGWDPVIQLIMISNECQ